MEARRQLTLVGHVTVDVLGARRRLGGAVTYGALAARRLGLQPRVVTAGARGTADALEQAGVLVVLEERASTTHFDHLGSGSRRELRVSRWAGPITMADPPRGNVLLAPVAREIGPFPRPWADDGRLVALAAQGLLREWGENGLVRHAGLSALPTRPDVIFVSKAEAVGLPPLGTAALVVTDGPREVQVQMGERALTLHPPALELADDVGAGDVFAVSCVAALLAGAAPLDAVVAGHAGVRDHLAAVQAEIATLILH